MQSNPAVRSPDAKDCPTARRIHRLGARPACIAALLLLSIHVLAAEPRPAIVQSIDAKAARFTDVAQQMGLENVVEMDGGFAEWKKRGYPVAERPTRR